MIFKLRDGFQTHHRDYNRQLFKSSEGKVARDKKESPDNIEKHYNKVFNREAQIDQLIPETLDQCPTNERMSTVPNKREVREAIKKMDNNKAPGCSQLATAMLKNIPEEGINFLTNLIRQYWIDKECQIELQNIQQLVSLYKGKRDMQNLNH